MRKNIERRNEKKSFRGKLAATGVAFALLLGAVGCGASGSTTSEAPATAAENTTAAEEVTEATEEATEEETEEETTEEEAQPTEGAQPTVAQPTQQAQQPTQQQPTQPTQPTGGSSSWSYQYHNDNGVVTVSTSGDFPEGVDPNNPASVQQWIESQTGVDYSYFFQ